MRVRWTAVVVLAVLAPCARAAEGVHIKGKGTTSLPWRLTDGAGYAWDIYTNGQIQDGTNDAYDGGMGLQVDGSQFVWSTAAKLHQNGREIEIGPWTRGTVRVWRRIYIDPKLGYCRWIDLFENTAGSAVTVNVRYLSNMGGSTQMIATTTGQPKLTPKDWAVVTGSTSSSSRPAIAHVFATKVSKFKPTFTWNTGSDNLSYHASLKIPAKRIVALCLIEAQRRPFDEAKKFLKAFKPEAELKKVPAALRRMIVNMGGSLLTLGQLELPRNEDHDLIVGKNENELLGTLLNPRYQVETFFGTLDLPAAKVLGFSSMGASNDQVQVGLVDGQVVVGKLVNGPLKLKLTTGNELALPVAKIQTASYRLSESRPEAVAVAAPLIVLRSGYRMMYKQADADLTFHTRHADLKLDADQLSAVLLDTRGGGLHQAVFRGGSVLSGLLTAEAFSLTLKLGPRLTVHRAMVERFVFPAAPASPSETEREMILRNDDRLIGRIAEKSLTVKTEFGDVKVKPSEITEVVFPEISLGRATIKLRDGVTVSGQFAKETIRFEITSGPAMSVYVAHIASIAIRGSEKKSTPAATMPVGVGPGFVGRLNVVPPPLPPVLGRRFRRPPVAMPARRARTRPARASAALRAAEAKARRAKLMKVLDAMRKRAATPAPHAAGDPRAEMIKSLEGELARLDKTIQSATTRPATTRPSATTKSVDAPKGTRAEATQRMILLYLARVAKSQKRLAACRAQLAKSPQGPGTAAIRQQIDAMQKELIVAEQHIQKLKDSVKK